MHQYGKSAARVRNAGKFMAWKTGIYGAHNADGKRPAYDSRTEQTELFHFTRAIMQILYL